MFVRIKNIGTIREVVHLVLEELFIIEIKKIQILIYTNTALLQFCSMLWNLHLGQKLSVKMEMEKYKIINVYYLIFLHLSILYHSVPHVNVVNVHTFTTLTWGTECLNIRFPLPTLLCAEYGVKLIITTLTTNSKLYLGMQQGNQREPSVKTFRRILEALCVYWGN